MSVYSYSFQVFSLYFALGVLTFLTLLLLVGAAAYFVFRDKGVFDRSAADWCRSREGRDGEYEKLRFAQLRHLRTAMSLGIAFGALSLAAFVTSMMAMYFDRAVWWENGMAMSCLAGGVMSGAMASFFMSQSFHVRAILRMLQRDREVTEAVRLAHAITEDHIRTRTYIALALHLSGADRVGVGGVEALARQRVEREVTHLFQEERGRKRWGRR